MNEWKSSPLSEVTTKIGSGATPRGGSSIYINEGIPFIRSQNIDDGVFDESGLVFIDLESARALDNVTTQEEDILLNITGESVARTCKVPKRLVGGRVNQHVAIIRSNDHVNSQFLLYALIQNKPVLDQMSEIGGTRRALTKGMLEGFEIMFPPHEEQKAIAEVLSSLDDKIDLLKRQNKTLEGMAEALFRQWFIEEAHDDWENSSLEHLIETTVGGEWGKENPQGDFVHKCLCMRGTDIADFANGDSQRTPERYLKESKVNKTRVTHGDLIIEISGGTDDQSTGRTFLYSNSARPLFPSTLVFSNFCRLIRPRIPELGTFLHFFIKYLLKKKFLFNLENGTSGIKNLDYKVLLFSEKFRLPPEGRMIEFHGQYVPLLDKIIANRIEIINLQNIHDTILPKLMSGEVRVQMD